MSEPRTEAGRRLLDAEWPKRQLSLSKQQQAADAILAIEQEEAALDVERLARALPPHLNYDVSPDDLDLLRILAHAIAASYARLSRQDSAVPQGAEE